MAFDPSRADACANCGQTGHRASQCKEPKDEERIKRNIQLHIEHKAKGHSTAVLKSMTAAMADALYEEQCGVPPDNRHYQCDSTDVDETDPESSIASEGEDEDEEETNRADSAKSHSK